MSTGDPGPSAMVTPGGTAPKSAAEVNRGRRSATARNRLKPLSTSLPSTAAPEQPGQGVRLAGRLRGGRATG
ncbi:hypothetical protein, partial [Micromonospora sp. 4G55]|uniref:hypothetical protein n=1 Tax=Micromonospora sp. 4G55 TaxID=2806102 RepID=UPI001EE4B020